MHQIAFLTIFYNYLNLCNKNGMNTFLSSAGIAAVGTDRIYKVGIDAGFR